MPETTEQEAADVAKDPRGPSLRPVCSEPAHRWCVCVCVMSGGCLGVGQQGRMWGVMSGGHAWVWDRKAGCQG